MAAPAGTFNWYGAGMLAVMAGDIPLDGADIYAMITTVDYVPVKDTHNFRDDVTNEVTGDGYTAGGQAVTASLSYDAASDECRFIVADPTWASSTITGRVVVFYRRLGGAASADPLIGYIVYDQNISSTNGPWTADIDSASAHGGALGYVDVS